MNRSYVLYAPTPWDSRRQPAHELAEALARRHPVLYVNPPLSPLTPLRYGLRAQSVTELRTILSRRTRRCREVGVFTPLVLPPIAHPTMRARSLPLYRGQVAIAVRRERLERPVVLAWAGSASLYGAAGEALRIGVVMDHNPSAAHLIGREPADLEAEMDATCESSELLCTTSHAMHELLRKRGHASELVPFGFAAELADRFDRAEEPAEYRALPRPLLGYTGSIDDRLDFDLLATLAGHHASGSIVLVGDVSPRLSSKARATLAAIPNLHPLGSREREELPAYVRFLDVALLPYRDTEFTRHQSPMKVWEYLYAGPPIVGSGSPELRLHSPDFLAYVSTRAEFIAATDGALARPAAGREQRRARALENTWDDRAVQIDRLVDKMAGRTGSPARGRTRGARLDSGTGTGKIRAFTPTPVATGRASRPWMRLGYAGGGARSTTQPIVVSSGRLVLRASAGGQAAMAVGGGGPNGGAARPARVASARRAAAWCAVLSWPRIRSAWSAWPTPTAAR
jgi:teichuronic acid biosynthesis glycosyltransferase TuaH